MVFGGCKKGDCNSRTSWKLDLKTKKWSNLPKLLPTGRYAPSCGVVRKDGVPWRVIVAGGKRGRSVLSKVEELMLPAFKWKTGKCSIKSGRSKFCYLKPINIFFGQPTTHLFVT